MLAADVRRSVDCPPMPPAFRFPDGFLFGAATAAHQVEGDNRHSDWWESERAGRLPVPSGEACRHWQLFREDFALARRFGHTAHRFSIEWSRIEPEPGRFDDDALDHYVQVVDELRRLGIEPVVTLQHFTLPRWFAARGGWWRRRHVDCFARYVDRVAARLAHRVRFWITVNEPTVWAKHACLLGDWPPHRARDPLAAARAILAMARAHRRAFEILHRHRPDAMVGIAHSAPFVEPARPGDPRDRFVAFARELALNRLPLVLVRRHLDFLGVNYYTRALVFWDTGGTAPLFGRDWPHAHGRAPRHFSDMGWEIHPEGLYRQLLRLSRLGLPLMVTENGLATADEELRTRFLEDHLAAVARALAGGVPVLGYLWWSLLDNFEWDSGFAPRFGLFATDYATFERRPRPVAFRFAEIIRDRSLAPAAAEVPVPPEASASPVSRPPTRGWTGPREPPTPGPSAGVEFVRLGAEQAEAIRRTVREIAGEKARVRLFGSRLDDAARGGDVDLLVELPEPVAEPVALAVRLEARLSRLLGGRKVDVVLDAPNLPDAPIREIARRTGHEL